MSNTFFAKGNHAFRNKKYQEALKNYLLAKKENPELSTFINTNIALIKRRAPNLLQQVTLFEENITPTIDYKNQTIDQVIKLAHEAMARDDWGAAYYCWNSLLERTDETLSISMLLRISKELFALDAFPEAEIALQRAEKCDPEHPGVLTTRAQQYYYHCYSSWLMLVTENEPDWYKADGLDKRPDWHTACELIERAEKVAPRNNLRRYVQAYLLLAEEAWGRQQPIQARTALNTALKAIGSNALDESLIQAIFAAVEQFRGGGIEQDPYYQTLQDHLQALPLELLSVPDWLCLNDILNWNGLLLCGYVAREKAVDLAIVQGKANPKHKEMLKTALKAALDRGDTALADKFLNNLKMIHPDALDVRELDSCCELMKGNLGAFRAKWPHPLTSAQQRLRDYLKGKSVAVVGPAPTGTMDGEEIDSFDIVGRTNWRNNPDKYDARLFGSNTHISLFNAHTTRLLNYKRQSTANNYVFYLARRESHKLNSVKNPVLGAKYPGNLYKSLSGIQYIIFLLLLIEVKKIKVFKATFYIGGKCHVDNYRGNKDNYLANITKVNLRPVFANHDLISNFNFMKSIAKKNLISFDWWQKEKIGNTKIYLKEICRSFKKNLDRSNFIELQREARRSYQNREWVTAADAYQKIFKNNENLTKDIYINYARTLSALSNFTEADLVIQKGMIEDSKEINFYRRYITNASDAKNWNDVLFRCMLAASCLKTIKNEDLKSSILNQIVKYKAIAYGNLNDYENSRKYIQKLISNTHTTYVSNKFNIKSGFAAKTKKNKTKLLCFFDDDSTLFVAKDFEEQFNNSSLDIVFGHIKHKGISRLSKRQLSLIESSGRTIETFNLEHIKHNIHKDNMLMKYDGFVFPKPIDLPENFFEKQNRPTVVTLFLGLDFYPVTGMLNRIQSDIICFCRKSEIELFKNIFPECLVGSKKLFTYNPKTYLPKQVELGKETKNIYFLTQAIVPLRKYQRLHILSTMNSLAKANPDKKIIIKLRNLENENKTHTHFEKYHYQLLTKELRAIEDNIKFSIEDMSSVIEKADICITCSSTAGVECILHGVPTLIWLDYPGAEMDPLTQKSQEFFKDSGLISNSDDILNLRIKKVNQNWLKDFDSDPHVINRIIDSITH